MKRATASPRSRKRLDPKVPARRGAAWTPETFARAMAGKALQPVPRKVLLSLRIDADVIEWFRNQGAGYQSRMNALLRAYMEAHRTP